MWRGNVYFSCQTESKGLDLDCVLLELGFEIDRDGVLENSATGVMTHYLRLCLGGKYMSFCQSSGNHDCLLTPPNPAKFSWRM